jgi:hypothetical protein
MTMIRTFQNFAIRAYPDGILVFLYYIIAYFDAEQKQDCVMYFCLAYLSFNLIEYQEI